MKRIATVLIAIVIGAIAGMSLPRAGAQIPVRTEAELQVVAYEAHLWRMSRVIEEQHALIMAATKIVNDRKDAELTAKFREAGFQVFDVVTEPEKPKK